MDGWVLEEVDLDLVLFMVISSMMVIIIRVMVCLNYFLFNCVLISVFNIDLGRVVNVKVMFNWKFEYFFFRKVIIVVVFWVRIVILFVLFVIGFLILRNNIVGIESNDLLLVIMFRKLVVILIVISNVICYIFIYCFFLVC